MTTTNATCTWCLLEQKLGDIIVRHPWHADGTTNERDAHLWSKGSKNGTPVFYTEENGWQ